MRKLELFALYFFVGLGIFFVVGLIHEASHVMNGKGARSVCWDFGYKIQDNIDRGYLIFHTTFNMDAYSSVSEYNTWREYSEKVATILSDTLYIFIGLFMGSVISSIYYNRDKKNEN